MTDEWQQRIEHLERVVEGLTSAAGVLGREGEARLTRENVSLRAQVARLSDECTAWLAREAETVRGTRALQAEITRRTGEAEMATEWMRQAEARRDEANALRSQVAQGLLEVERLRADLTRYQAFVALAHGLGHTEIVSTPTLVPSITDPVGSPVNPGPKIRTAGPER
jgi:predicted RNase H-like nuclease (RuvC/YqgF family)